MAILTKNEILKLLKSKKMEIKPFKKDQVGPGSIDLTLSSEFRIFKKKSKINVTEFLTYKDYTEPVKKSEIKLKPGEFINGITVENIKLPSDICGILTGRSKFARIGVLVHATASFIQPGINNRQVLEIKNISKNILILKPGIRICQLVLMETKGNAKYNGRYRNQKSI